jgi:hypothetical protein
MPKKKKEKLKQRHTYPAVPEETEGSALEPADNKKDQNREYVEDLCAHHDLLEARALENPHVEEAYRNLDHSEAQVVNRFECEEDDKACVYLPELERPVWPANSQVGLNDTGGEE